MSEDSPAGWYDDGSARLRYWDGMTWTAHVAPAPNPASHATASTPTPGTVSGLGVPQPRNAALGYNAIATAALGAIAASLPWTVVELIGIVLLIAGFVLSGMALHRDAKKWAGYVGLGVAILGTLIGVFMFVIGFVHGYTNAA